MTLLQTLNQAYEALMIPLRMGDGLSKEAYESFCKNIRMCTQEWKKQDHIPKLAANIFIDAYSAMISSSYLYSQDHGEEIRCLAEEMNEAIRECVAIPESLP